MLLVLFLRSTLLLKLLSDRRHYLLFLMKARHRLLLGNLKFGLRDLGVRPTFYSRSHFSGSISLIYYWALVCLKDCKHVFALVL